MTARWLAATLVHNTADLAARMREQLPDVLVIDNGSHPPIDGAAISLPLNRGFVGGWNEAMRRIIAERPDVDYVWMLNSDVEGVSVDMARGLCNAASAVFASVVTPAFNSPHAVFHQDKYYPGVVRMVDWIDWCCPMVSVEAWERVGEFDPASTGYFADVDWCKRCTDSRQNWPGFYVHDGYSVNHLGSVTAQRIGHTWNADDTWLCRKWGVRSWTELI